MYDTRDRLNDVKDVVGVPDLTVEAAGWQLEVFLVLSSWFLVPGSALVVIHKSRAAFSGPKAQ